MAKQNGTETSDTLEQQVIAYAEQLGRVVGAVEAKAEGWLDTEKLNEQISRVRDGATAILERLGAMTETKTERIVGSQRTGRNMGRSGGVVDAPGKKHRKPTPSVKTPRSAAADARRLSKLKGVQGHRRRGRR